MEDFKVPTLPVQASPTAVKSDTTADKPSSSTASQGPSLCPAESQEDLQQQQKAAVAETCPYKVPPWSAPPPATIHYKFEVLKSGSIIDEIKELQQQANWKFGRLPANDIEMAHPTISRFHAVLQYRPSAEKNDDEDANESSDAVAKPEEGWYIYDLGSTHGTFLNKQRVPPRVFIRVRVGHMLRLGNSTRAFILQGPSDDEEPESELSVTELRAQKQRQDAEAAAEAQRKAAEDAERARNEGVAWGMGEDADEETDLSHNPFAATNNEELFLDDPKRTLRGYFEREGLNLEYKCDEMSTGSFVCRVELPLDDSNGRPITAEVVHKGRKKECVVQCALEACRILDRHGVLRQANKEPLKRKSKMRGSDSDDDEFWDRTGDVERKKERRAKANTSVTLTYKDLIKRGEELDLQLLRVDAQIENYHATRLRLKESKLKGKPSNIDDLDSYMMNLCDDLSHMDKTEIRKLRIEQQQLKVEKQKVVQLAKIAKPVELKFTSTALTKPTVVSNYPETATAKIRPLPIIGKRNQFTRFKMLRAAQQTVTKPATASRALASDEEEVEDDDDDDLEIKPAITIEQKSSPIDPKKEEKTEDLDTKSEAEGDSPPALSMPEDDDQPEEANQSSTASTSKKGASTESNSGAESVESAGKKRRQRHRLRQKRQEVDIEELEEHESSEKYAKWMPPENQSGDGYTKLNEKYGY